MSGTVTPSSITFDELPYDLLDPGTYVEVRANYANLGLVGYPARVLLIGQMAAAGAAAAVRTPYPITRDDQADGLFGPGSQLAQMVRAFRAANRFTAVDAMGDVPPGGATAATGTVTITGAAAQAGTVPFYVAGRRVPVIVKPGDSVATMAAALVAAVAADAAQLPVTAANAAGVVTLTAKQPGAWGNDVDVRIGLDPTEARPPGFVAAVAPMAGGAGVPDLTALLSPVASTWYTDVACAFADSASLGVLATELARRYVATVRLDAHGYVGFRGTQGAALAQFGAGLVNSKFLSVIPAQGAASPPWSWAASLAGVAAFNLANDPARQLRTLALPGIVGPAPAQVYSDQQQDQLLRNGCSTWNRLSDGTVVLDRVITTYQLSPLGIVDRAWLDVTVPKTASRIRYDWASFVGLNYPRHKLADDGAVAAAYSDAVVTPRAMQAAWAGRCKLYERLAWIEDAKRTSAASVFARDASDRNRLNARQQVRIIGNLIVLAAALEFEA